MNNSITLRAFAKINLSLRITGVRADGFHGVETILQAIDLSDRVTCARRRGLFEIRCDMPGVPTDHTNLAWKAADALWKAAGRDGEPRDTVITLQKNIPKQAGLGGGSSDAAAALMGLRKLWKLRVADEEIHAIGARLGSDVPFFLVGGTALGLGRGDEIYPLEQLPRHWVVLAIPPFGVATQDAYRWYDAAPRNYRGRVRVSSAGAMEIQSRPLIQHVRFANDLEAAVIERHPEIGQLKQRFTERGAIVAAMSGSGSAVFGVFPSRTGANAAARALKGGAVRVLTTRFLPRKRRT